MKNKFLFALICATIFTSCQNEEIEDNPDFSSQIPEKVRAKMFKFSSITLSTLFAVTIASTNAVNQQVSLIQLLLLSKPA